MVQGDPAQSGPDPGLDGLEIGVQRHGDLLISMKSRDTAFFLDNCLFFLLNKKAKAQTQMTICLDNLWLLLPPFPRQERAPSLSRCLHDPFAFIQSLKEPLQAKKSYLCH